MNQSDPTHTDAGQPTESVLSDAPSSENPSTTDHQELENQIDTSDPDTPAPGDEDQGPGCMPAMVAAAALMGIVGFITCALMTWVIFQKRTEIAARTLEGSVIPPIEQSLLDPVTKQEVLTEVEDLMARMKSGQIEDWQAAEVMQRILKLPVLQWGELQALEKAIQSASEAEISEEEKQQAIQTLQRLREAISTGKVFSFDLDDVLEPIRQPSRSTTTGTTLKNPISSDDMLEAVRRAELLSNRAGIEAPSNQEYRMSEILQKEIREGLKVQD